MSTFDGITVVAPEPADMQRDDEVQTSTLLLAPRHGEMQRGPCNRITVYVHHHLDYVRGHLGDLRNLPDDLRRDCNDEEICSRCLTSCLFFFFCHALGELFLQICFVCQFVPCLEVTTPGHLKPRNNRTEKFFAFLAKHLSKLLMRTLLVALFIQWVLFRPIDVKPHLGTSVIHAFDLQQADGAMAATPHLRFNLTGYLLFKSPYGYYNVHYNYLAVSVLYAGEKLGPVDDELPSFKQAPQGRTVTRFFLVGQLRNASSTVPEMFSGDRDKGLFELVVRIRVMLAYKSWPFKQNYFASYDCPLSSPFPQTGEPALSSPAWCKTNDI